MTRSRSGGVLRQALTDPGHHVLTAENGQQALDALSRSDTEVMLLDIKMPRLSGLDVLSEVQVRSPGRFSIAGTRSSASSLALASLPGP